jgi:membrane protein
VVVVSLLGVFGEGKRTTDALLQPVGDLGPGSTVDTLRGPIEQLCVGLCRRVRPGDESHL